MQKESASAGSFFAIVEANSTKTVEVLWKFRRMGKGKMEAEMEDLR